MLIDQGVELPFLMVATQCPQFQYWEIDRLKTLVDEILNLPEID